MVFQKIKDANGKDEYVLIPVSIFQAIEKKIELLLKDPIYAALMNAPEDDEPVTDEEESLVAEAVREMEKGQGVPHDEVKRRFGL